MTVSGLAARGPGEAWATGYEQDADGLRPMLYRWDGTAWRDAKVPLPPNSNVHTVLPELSGRVTIGGSPRVPGEGDSRTRGPVISR